MQINKSLSEEDSAGSMLPFHNIHISEATYT